MYTPTFPHQHAANSQSHTHILAVNPRHRSGPVTPALAVNAEPRLGDSTYASRLSRLCVTSEPLPGRDETSCEDACGGDGDRQEQPCRKISGLESGCCQERRWCPGRESIDAVPAAAAQTGLLGEKSDWVGY